MPGSHFFGSSLSADDLAALPAVAEDGERVSGKRLEVDWRMAEELRGPSSALGEGIFLIWSLENRSELLVAAGPQGGLGPCVCPEAAVA